MFDSFSSLVKNKCLFYPERRALSYNEQAYSYKELNQCSNQLAYYFASKGIKNGTIAAIISRNYLMRVISILAIWKLGAAYLPIEPDYPLTRIKFILHDAKSTFIITDTKIHEKILSVNNSIFPILLDEHDIISTFPTADLPDSTQSNDIAYISYTSGSTGNPKGAIITQSNILSIYNAWSQVYKLTRSDRHLQIASFGFDVCSGDIIRAFGSGAELIICPCEIILQPKPLYELLEKKAITIAEFTPTILRKLITYLDKKKLNLHFMRLLICGSDSWSFKEYKHFKSFLNPVARLVNSYGTTETTIDNTYFEISGLDTQIDDGSSVPIGQPFPNSTIKILDEKLEECLPGMQGEIYIGGTGVSAGYFNQPALTKEKFVTLSFENNENKIFYKTGDLGSYLSDGNISFLGRIDDKIKIMGCRVGLTEVENIFHKYPTLQECVIIPHYLLKLNENFLIAFIMVSNEKFKENEFISFLKENAPLYMIPSVYLLISSLPVSLHGKLDRRKLSDELTSKLEPSHFQQKFNGQEKNTENIEEILVKIFAKTFNIYIEDVKRCFFILNTHALLLDQFSKELRLYFNLKFEQAELTEIHTIIGLKKFVIDKTVSNFWRNEHVIEKE
jgi:amino acid adenylation domain-containing protein